MSTSVNNKALEDPKMKKIFTKTRTVLYEFKQ